jgi:hypothetical protein
LEAPRAGVGPGEKSAKEAAKMSTQDVTPPQFQLISAMLGEADECRKAAPRAKTLAEQISLERRANLLQAMARDANVIDVTYDRARGDFVLRVHDATASP